MMEISQIDRWRLMALEFHAIREMTAAHLKPDFEPRDLARVRRKIPASAAVRGILSFMLHIWNSQNHFELSDVRLWDREHRLAFTKWVTGSALREPCLYF